MTSLIYWVLAILMFGILVMLHEFGHFIAARLTGVTVLEFAVGFGPKLLSRKAKSGVRYSLRLLPFGGYCRFVGEEDEPEEGMEGPRADTYASEKIWKRALISLFGPLMNVLTALVLLFLLYFAIGLPIGPEPVIGSLMEGLPAEQAGFEVGDRIVAINGVDIESTEQASALISQAGDRDIEFIMERDGEAVILTVRPAWMEEEDPPRYMIGIEYQMGAAPVRFDFITSARNAVIMTGDMSKMIVEVLRDLIFKGEGMEDLSGPVGTVTIIKEQTQSGGLFNYVYLASVISVNLGLFNLLPIPGLDGSKLIFLAYEKIRGKPLDPGKEGVVTLVGFALLMGLMLMALYQDIMRLLAR